MNDNNEQIDNNEQMDNNLVTELELRDIRTLKDRISRCVTERLADMERMDYVIIQQYYLHVRTDVAEYITLDPMVSRYQGSALASTEQLREWSHKVLALCLEGRCVDSPVPLGKITDDDLDQELTFLIEDTSNWSKGFTDVMSEQFDLDPLQEGILALEEWLVNNDDCEEGAAELKEYQSDPAKFINRVLTDLARM